MGFSGFAVFLAVGMLLTGSLNTLSTKLADVSEAPCLDGKTREFNHPFAQAMGMFIGESLCLGAFMYTQWRNRRAGRFVEHKQFSPSIFILPALCDMGATSLMYVGLTLTHASTFQMLRGSVVIFTGLLSVLALKRKLYSFHWCGMILVLAGLACVGVASMIEGGSSSSAPNPLLGNIFVIAAQLIVACQMVVEEKFVGKYDVPALVAVGWEGIFGFCIMTWVLVAMYYIPGSSVGNHFENTPNAIYQLGGSWVILLATLGNVISIAFFNFFGISVTKEMNATSRMVLDSVRTFVIWAVSLAVGWQTFQYMQVIGFALLLLGTCVYNKLVVIPIRFFNPVIVENQDTADLLTTEYPSAVSEYDDDAQDA